MIAFVIAVSALLMQNIAFDSGVLSRSVPDAESMQALPLAVSTALLAELRAVAGIGGGLQL